MPAKKSASTSKTARVLNVISGEASSAAEDVVQEPEHSAGAPIPVPAAEPRRPVPPILEMVKANDEALSEQIRVAMEEELRAQAPPVQVPPATPQVASAVAPTAPAAATQPPEQAPVAPSGQAPVPPVGSAQNDLDYVNIMQTLVEEKAAGFMKLFGLCTCHRCVTDVKALALTNLPPKYVVMRKGEVVPMLTVYEGRYSATIIAQLTNACRVVMSSPRHQR